MDRSASRFKFSACVLGILLFSGCLFDSAPKKMGGDPSAGDRADLGGGPAAAAPAPVVQDACAVAPGTQVSPYDPSAKAGTPKYLLIANGLSEDFWLASGLDSEVKAKGLENADEAEEHPCSSVNHVAESPTHLYFTCSTSQDIHVYKKEGLALERLIYLGNNVNPMEVALLNPSKAYVTSLLQDKVIIFNPSPSDLNGGARVIGEIPLRGLKLETDPGESTLPHPSGMAIAGRYLYVALGNLNQAYVAGGPGYVVVIDTCTDEVQKVIKTSARDATSVRYFPGIGAEGRLLISNSGTYRTGEGKGFIGDGTIDVLNPATNEIEKTIPIGGAPFELTVASNGLGFATNGADGRILVFDTHKFEALAPIDVRNNGCNHGIPGDFSYISALQVVGSRLFATEFKSNCLLTIDLASRAVLSSTKVGDGPDVMVPMYGR